MPDDQARLVPVQAMGRLVRHHSPQPSPKAQVLHQPVFLGYLLWLACALVLLLWEPEPKVRQAWPEGVLWGWAAGVLFVLGTVTSLVSLARRLPPRNVAACVGVIVALATVLATVGAKTGLPGYFDGYTKRLGPRLLGLTPWSVPFLWFVIVFNSREVAKLILRPWRRDKQYGFWLVALAAALVVAMALVLEPFATRVQGWWSWRATLTPALNWLGVPWTSFVGWFVEGCLVLVFVGPWLTRRRPIHQSSDFHGPVVWVSFALLFTAGNALARLWPAVLAGAFFSLVVAWFAWRNGRQLPPAPRPPLGAPPPDAQPPPRQVPFSGPSGPPKPVA